MFAWIVIGSLIKQWIMHSIFFMFCVFQEKLGKFADDKKEFEVFQQVCLCTLDIILNCAFSYQIDVQRSGYT